MKTQTFQKMMTWLRCEENSEAKLAFLLGYKTTATISHWIKLKRIPRLAEKHVLKIIEPKEKK